MLYLVQLRKDESIHGILKHLEKYLNWKHDNAEKHTKFEFEKIAINNEAVVFIERERKDPNWMKKSLLWCPEDFYNDKIFRVTVLIKPFRNLYAIIFDGKPSNEFIDERVVYKIQEDDINTEFFRSSQTDKSIDKDIARIYEHLPIWMMHCSRSNLTMLISNESKHRDSVMKFISSAQLDFETIDKDIAEFEVKNVDNIFDPFPKHERKKRTTKKMKLVEKNFSEGDYNQRICEKDSSRLKLIDKTHRDSRNIEVCDVLDTKNNVHNHVKRKGKKNSEIHKLAMQGMLGACFVASSEYDLFLTKRSIQKPQVSQTRIQFVILFEDGQDHLTMSEKASLILACRHIKQLGFVASVLTISSA